MLFSVIIPTYKDWERLEKCVNNVLSSDGGNFDFEIIIIDNERIHNPPESFKIFANTKLLHEPAPGSYTARNRGVKSAKGRYLAFLDADCIPDNDWLRNAKLLFNEKYCDLIGGRIDIFKEDNASAWAYIYEKHNSFPQSRNVPKGRCVTANFFIKRDLFEKLGGFDSSLKSGGDWEFSERAVKAGFQLCYADNVIVRHPARRSISAILKKQKRLTSWGYLKVKKRLGYSAFRILASNSILGLKGIFRRAQSPNSLYEKSIVILISITLYLSRIFWLTAIILKISDPKKIRE